MRLLPASPFLLPFPALFLTLAVAGCIDDDNGTPATEGEPCTAGAPDVCGETSGGRPAVLRCMEANPSLGASDAGTPTRDAPAGNELGIVETCGQGEICTSDAEGAWCDDPPTPAPPATPGASNMARRLCARAMQCGLVSAAEQSECESSLARAYPYLPDPDAVATCIEALDCATLEEDSDDLVEHCADINYSSFRCNGTTLTYCNNRGTCASLDCVQLCQNLAGTANGTCVDGDEGHVVCHCELRSAFSRPAR